jgi:hypothetical protein
MPKNPNKKNAYVVSCSTRFREQVEGLVQNRKNQKQHINIADLTRAVLLLIPPDVIEAQPDPGEPDPNDRDIVTVKGGKASGRSMPRKPRFQVRLPQQTDPATIRKALGLALSFEHGWSNLSVNDNTSDTMRRKLENAEAEIKRLQGLTQLLAFEPLEGGIKTRRDALYVLGFAADAMPAKAAIKARFRTLARIFHPDINVDPKFALFNDHRRMAQLNDAMKLLSQ